MKMKKGKINLGVIILSIIAIILLVAVVIIGIDIINIKITEDRILTNENKENELEQEKVAIDNKNDDLGVNVSDDKILEMAKVTLEKYVRLADYEYKAMPYILSYLGLETEENLEEIVGNTYDTTTYVKTNTKYEDFKNEMLKYVTEEFFEKEFSHYKNMDGYVGVVHFATEIIPISVSKIELISKKRK